MSSESASVARLYDSKAIKTENLAAFMDESFHHLQSLFSLSHKNYEKTSRDGENKKFFVSFQMEKIETFMHEKRT